MPPFCTRPSTDADAAATEPSLGAAVNCLLTALAVRRFSCRGWLPFSGVFVPAAGGCIVDVLRSAVLVASAAEPSVLKLLLSADDLQVFMPR